jgi:hypothetical protein
MAQDRGFEFTQRWQRFETEFLTQGAPEAAVDLKRLGLPAAAVEGQHELAMQPLAERMLID